MRESAEFLHTNSAKLLETMSGASMLNVFDISQLPPEILTKIILYLNTRERISLAMSSKMIHSLLFGVEKLSRDLDFSKDGRLTSATDIQQYFENESTSKHIMKVNLSNVNCMEPGQMLNSYIGKALNLVDINIHGTELKNVQQLRNFLELLLHVKRLSIDWPKTASANDDAVLQRSFGTLTYLSVKIYSASCFTNLITYLKLCQELTELRLRQENSDVDEYEDVRDTLFSNAVLRNLEIAEVTGNCASCFKKYLVTIFPDPREWTLFQLPHPLFLNGYYFEKNIKVCDELVESLYKSERNTFHPGSRIIWKRLFQGVFRTIGMKAHNQNTICCISQPGQCLLKVEEAKLLLENPRYPITYLYTTHSIGTECDAHLLASAFPALSELHICNITKSENSISRGFHSSKSLECSGMTYRQWVKEANYTGQVYTDSSFKMLVEGSPRIADLTLSAKIRMLEPDEVWDLSALDLIPGWRFLKSLRLSSLPIVDGNFLIKIGKECTRLEKLELYDLGASDVCCYTKELALMLLHCENLMDFSMKANNVGQMSEVLFSLAKNFNLRRVRLVLTTSNEINTTTNLIPAVEQLLRASSKLTTFVFIIDGISQAYSDLLTSALQSYIEEFCRLRSELNRPTFQFQVVRVTDPGMALKIDTVREDSIPLSFPYNFEEFIVVDC